METSSAERSRLSDLLRQGQSVSNFELVNHKKSGEPYHVALNIEPIRDAHGEVCAYLSIQSDITERRQQERHTVELKQRLEVAQRLARLGRIDTEVETGRPRWSSEVFRILGMVPDEEPREFDGLLAFAVPEDVADLRRNMAARVEAGEDILAGFTQAALDGQPDPHPTVVIKIVVGDLDQRRTHRLHGARLSVTRYGRTCARRRAQTCRTQLRRDQRQCLLHERRGHICVDDWQAPQVELRQPILRPCIGLSCIRVNGVSHELLAKAQHLERGPANAAKRRACAVDQQALRRPANPQRRGVAKPNTGQLHQQFY